MKQVLVLIIVALVAVIAIAMFDFQVTDSGSLPEVEVTGGEMPNADIRGPEVDMQTEQREVEYPSDVDVKTDTATMEIPTDVDIELPEDRESEELVEGE